MIRVPVTNQAEYTWESGPAAVASQMRQPAVLGQQNFVRGVEHQSQEHMRPAGRETYIEQQYQELRSLLRRVPGMSLPMEMAAPESYADSPFTDDIATVALPKGFNVPPMTLFDGTTDPCDHISQFKQKMMVTAATRASKEACMCKGFGSTLTGAALQWFVGLPNGTISSFADLVNTFNQQFPSSRRTPKQPSDLYKIVQEIGESIKDYVTRFNAEKIQEVQRELQRRLRLEEDIQAIKGITNFDKPGRKIPTEKKDERAKPYIRPNISRIAEKTQQVDDSQHPPKISDYGFNTGMKGLLKALRGLGDQVHRGNLDHLLSRGGKQDRRETANQVLPSVPPICTKIINVITSGSELSGLTYSAAKRKATGSKGDHPETSCRVSQSNLPPVTFDETDIESGAEQHDDALTITLSIGNCTVRKALVDTGSSVNLIMLETLKTMGFDKENLIKKSVSLVGFSGETAHSVGEITIPTYIEGVNKLDTRYLLSLMPGAATIRSRCIHKIKRKQHSCQKEAYIVTMSCPLA
ncbi:uncharacterized protein LOC141628987 [Silene latifolia]|uniref:uncharacterized protein LOC141628987 n=1 Tax=Silene latifolia TaxID=37657 RepID=UPI003D776A59